MHRHDVVIAGCGISGAIAALTALEQELEVCVVERCSKETIGKKVCGGLMLQESLQWIKQTFDISVESYPLKGLEIRASGGNILHVPIPLCTVTRWQLGQACLHALIERGCSLRNEPVTHPLTRGENVSGVKTPTNDIMGRVTIDSSGVSSIIRRKILPLSSGPEILGLAYREILQLKDPVDFSYAVLWFDKKLIPAGYFWCFPKSLYQVNVGAGGLIRGHSQLKQKLHAFIQHLGLKVDTILDRGVGVVPLGEPLASQVSGGVLICGDAAHHVNPLTGEGIAPALRDGYHAGLTAAEAIQKSDVSAKGLWKYNMTYAHEYGKIHAPLVLLRDFLVSLTHEELNFFLGSVITGEEFGDILNGIFPHLTWNTVCAVVSHLNRLSLFKKAYTVLQKMRQMQHHYSEFPSEPDTFLSWKKTRDHIMGKAVKK